jgi:hypothetical protein
MAIKALWLLQRGVMLTAAEQSACTPTVSRWLVENEKLLAAGEANRYAAGRLV